MRSTASYLDQEVTACTSSSHLLWSRLEHGPHVPRLWPVTPMIALLGWFEAFGLFTCRMVGSLSSVYFQFSPYFSWGSQSYWHPSSVSCTALRISDFELWRNKTGHCFAFLQVCGQDMFWRTVLDYRDFEYQTFLAAWFFVSFRVFVGFSSNVTPSSSFFKLKYSTNIWCCSWQPRRLKWRVSRYHALSIKEWFGVCSPSTRFFHTLDV